MLRKFYIEICPEIHLTFLPQCLCNFRHIISLVLSKCWSAEGKNSSAVGSCPHDRSRHPIDSVGLPNSSSTYLKSACLNLKNLLNFVSR